MRRKAHAMSLATVAATALAVAGCGGAAHRKATTLAGAALPHAASSARVAQLDAETERCDTSGTTGEPGVSCASASAAEAAIRVIWCAAGLSTDASCVFAGNVQQAVAAAAQATGRMPPAMLTPHSGTPPNPVACSGTTSRWMCTSERNHAVWVRFRQ